MIRLNSTNSRKRRHSNSEPSDTRGGKKQKCQQGFRVFIRVDNSEQIHKPKFTQYNVSPGEHMNLNPNTSTLYEQSGFLSAFELKGKNDEAIWNSFSAISGKNIHIIILDPSIIEEINLDGGISGLEDGTWGIQPIRSDGSVWKKPQFNVERAQIFDPSGVSVQLRPDQSISMCECLLGGNWYSNAYTITFERYALQKHLEQPYLDFNTVIRRYVEGQLAISHLHSNIFLDKTSTEVQKLTDSLGIQNYSYKMNEQEAFRFFNIFNGDINSRRHKLSSYINELPVKSFNASAMS